MAEIRASLHVVLARLEAGPNSVPEWNAIVDAITIAKRLAESERLLCAPSPEIGESTKGWLRRVGVR